MKADLQAMGITWPEMTVPETQEAQLLAGKTVVLTGTLTQLSRSDGQSGLTGIRC
ncbi:hypothetical protein P4S72_06670 [Vibrio sp. PP-XX7]